ncbi:MULTISPECIES: DUF6221 family protein [unclassified Nocardiopsis]|uniref:DUF6221 family protein n=1 Tax=unclassified Nocardiopsis TaxID=2649073 RepID=UPI0013596F54|nr:MULTISPECIES: DUF6221 family protein [unclassified Nocardiopsis]
MQDLISWLRSQIEADERAANAFHSVTIAAAHSDVNTEHDGAYDHYRLMVTPTSILADVQAKLTLLELYEGVMDLDSEDWSFSGAHGRANGLGEAIRTIAQAYRDRPGWTRDWER